MKNRAEVYLHMLANFLSSIPESWGLLRRISSSWSGRCFLLEPYQDAKKRAQLYTATWTSEYVIGSHLRPCAPCGPLGLAWMAQRPLPRSEPEATGGGNPCSPPRCALCCAPSAVRSLIMETYPRPDLSLHCKPYSRASHVHHMV